MVTHATIEGGSVQTWVTYSGSDLIVNSDAGLQGLRAYNGIAMPVPRRHAGECPYARTA